jgi:predicted amidophosphoribosyltransferase
MRGAKVPGLLTSLVAPPTCAVCASATDPSLVLCSTCERELARGHGHRLRIDGVDSAWAARRYEGIARDLIAAIKFRRLLSAARRGAALIAGEAPPAQLEGTLVPVAADPLRAAWRGFDPAEVLAGELARASGLPLADCLARGHHRRQVGRSRRERLASPPRIRAVGAVPVAAILVDDVTTTGATLAAAAAALRAAGSRRVAAVVLAAAPA